MNGLDALWAFLVAGAVTLLVTPQAARLAHRVGAIDQPRERSLHEFPTPSLGGLAILAGVLVAGLLFLPFSTETKGILAGAIAIAFTGAIDDTLPEGLSPLPKLAGPVPGRGAGGGLQRAGREPDAALHRAAGPGPVGDPADAARASWP